MDKKEFTRLINQKLENNEDYKKVLRNTNKILVDSMRSRYDGKNPMGYLDAIICIEECAELQQALTKALRGKLDKDNLLEEICDVELCLVIIKKIYHISPEKLKTAKYIKLKRLIQRIKNGNNN